ncbi:hypothetical protein J4E08_22770, partial [Sagittula sp. NFXS13]|uniref:hypothetical protein n=1 Tax=Sagittula sp. NFXS13 TaxID=2819095 RepID=UPI0032E056C0
PASCSAKMPMICSSVNLVRFIVRPQVGPDSNRRWRKNPVAGHALTKAVRAQNPANSSPERIGLTANAPWNALAI